MTATTVPHRHAVASRPVVNALAWAVALVPTLAAAAIDWMADACWPTPRAERPRPTQRLLRWASVAEVGVPAVAVAALVLAMLLTGCEAGEMAPPVPATTGAVPTPAKIT